MATPAKRCLTCHKLTRGSSRCSECQGHLDARRDKRHNDARRFYRTYFWRKLRAKVLKRDQQCVLCGSKLRLVVHHLEPRPQNEPDPIEGIDVESNLVTLCHFHHNAIEQRIRQGKKVPLLEAYKSIQSAG